MAWPRHDTTGGSKPITSSFCYSENPQRALVEVLSLNTSSAGLPPILEAQPGAAEVGCAHSPQEVDEVAESGAG